jgi:hypothetical protein
MPILQPVLQQLWHTRFRHPTCPGPSRGIETLLLKNGCIGCSSGNIMLLLPLLPSVP